VSQGLALTQRAPLCTHKYLEIDTPNACMCLLCACSLPGGVPPSDLQYEPAHCTAAVTRSIRGTSTCFTNLQYQPHTSKRPVLPACHAAQHQQKHKQKQQATHSIVSAACAYTCAQQLHDQPPAGPAVLTAAPAAAAAAAVLSLHLLLQLSAVQFHLITTTILFLSREGFRRGGLRIQEEAASSSSTKVVGGWGGGDEGAVIALHLDWGGGGST
jgi:hypothetical protein